MKKEESFTLGCGIIFSYKNRCTDIISRRDNYNMIQALGAYQYICEPQQAIKGLCDSP